MIQYLSRLQKAYIAGFLDGDGSIYVQAKPNATYRYKFQVAPYIVLFQSGQSRKNFEKLCSLIGVGYMRKRNDGILEYIIGREKEIKNFLHAVKPYITLKKDQAKLMSIILERKACVASEKDFGKLLRLIDKFRNLNYSKNRKKRKLTP